MSETPAQTSNPETAKKRSHKKVSSDNGQKPKMSAPPKAQDRDETPEEKMAAFVARAKKNWKESVEAAKTQQEFVNKPDGNYILRLTGADYGVGGNGKLRIMWMYTCLEGKYLGETFYDFSNLEQEDAETWLASKLHRLGVDIDEYDPAQLEETLKALIQEGSAYAVTLKSKPSKNDPDKVFQQFFINKKLGADFEPDLSDDDNDEENMNKTKKKSAPVSTKPSSKKTEVDEEEEDDEDVEIEVGDKVSYDKGEKTYKGTVEEVDEDEGMAKLLLENGKTVNRPIGILSIVEKADKDEDDEEEDDEEDDEDDDEEVELKEGSRVEFRWKGEDKGPGVVKSIDAESGIVRISFEKKVYPVKVDAISVLDDEDDDDDDEDEIPAKKKGKK